MAAAGYTGGTIQKLFSKQLQKIQEGAASRLSESSHVVAAVAESGIDIKVPQTEISLRSLVRYIRDLLGIPVTRISGSCITKNNALIVAVSITGHEGFEIPATWAEFDKVGPLEDALLRAADETFLRIEPITAATYNYNQGKRDEALAALGKCFEKQTAEDDYQAYALWGRILTDRGEYSTAIEKFKKSLGLKSNYIIAKLHSANTLDEWGQHQRALAAYNEIIKAHPKETNGYIDRGICFINLKRYRDAADDFERALELNPHDKSAKELLIGNMPELNETSSAKQMSTELMALHPKSGRWVELSGEVLFKDEKYPEAIESFTKALQLANTEAARSSATFGRARCYQRIHAWEKAISDYKMSLKEDPDQMLAWYNLGILLRKQNGTNWEVLQCFEKAVNLDRTDDDCLLQRGYAYKDLGMRKEAKADFNAVIALPDSRSSHREKAQQQIAAIGEIEKAESEMLVDLKTIGEEERNVTHKKKKKKY